MPGHDAGGHAQGTLLVLGDWAAHARIGVPLTLMSLALAWPWLGWAR